MLGHSSPIPSINPFKPQPSLFFWEAKTAPSYFGTSFPHIITLEQERTQNFFDFLLNSLRKNPIGSPENLYSKQDRAYQLDSTRIGEELAGPAPDPGSQPINQSIAVNLLQLGGDKGDPKVLYGERAFIEAQGSHKESLNRTIKTACKDVALPAWRQQNSIIDSIIEKKREWAQRWNKTNSPHR